jgi:anthranilate phosphoribosyltransferase
MPYDAVPMSVEAPRFQDVFAEMTSGAISPATVRRVFEAIFAGAWTPSMVGGFLVGLRTTKTDTPGVIAAAAAAMRSAMVRVEHDFERVLDTCGTGGDGSSTQNLSTGAALIVAAAGVPVAKHGNRAATSRSGSADVLEALGIPLDVAPNLQSHVLRDANIAFLFAQSHHPAMRHAMPSRRELGIRTLFNCLGPLANPAGATHQLIGAYDQEIRPIIAGALKELGTTRAWVIRSVDNLDEVSPFAVTRVTELDSGKLTEFEIAPEDFGINPSAPGAIAGGDANDNARVLETVLAGKPHPATDAFVLNAAAALVVAEGIAPKAAADRAREMLANGKALATLNRFRDSALRRRTVS